MRGLANKVNSWGEQLTAEYTTASVINEVTSYIESHNGQWPRSWSDMSDGDYARHYVQMRFDVSTDELIANPDLIQTVIVPKSGVYHTYPHARDDLDQLQAILVRFRANASTR